MAIGSPDLAPKANAAAGVVGAKIASTVSNARSKSRAISVRTRCALR